MALKNRNEANPGTCPRRAHIRIDGTNPIRFGGLGTRSRNRKIRNEPISTRKALRTTNLQTAKRTHSAAFEAILREWHATTSRLQTHHTPARSGNGKPIPLSLLLSTPNKIL